MTEEFAVGYRCCGCETTYDRAEDALVCCMPPPTIEVAMCRVCGHVTGPLEEQRYRLEAVQCCKDTPREMEWAESERLKALREGGQGDLLGGSHEQA